MDIEIHKNNLKKYIEEDMAFKEPLKNISDFDKYCYNHCLDIKEVLSELDKNEKIIYNLAFALADYVMYYEYDKCRNPEMIKNKAKEIFNKTGEQKNPADLYQKIGGIFIPYRINNFNQINPQSWQCENCIFSKFHEASQ